MSNWPAPIVKPEFAPGCFGSAYSFQDDETCQRCPFYEPCKVKHTRARKWLDAYFVENWTLAHENQNALSQRKRRANKTNNVAQVLAITEKRPERRMSRKKLAEQLEAATAGMTDEQREAFINEEEARRKREKAAERQRAKRERNKAASNP